MHTNETISHLNVTNFETMEANKHLSEIKEQNCETMCDMLYELR